MTTYNTGNPIGSKDPRDLYDNAENFDSAINDVVNPSFEDRFGRQRTTLKGYDDKFQQFLIDSGYVNIGDYGPGLEITERNQIFWRDGELYRAGAALELPYTTTGDWSTEEGLFVGVGDAALRQELGSTKEGSGGALIIAKASVYVDTITDLIAMPIATITTNQAFIVGRYSSSINAGGGHFVWDEDNEEEVDGGNIFQSDNSQIGRWVRLEREYSDDSYGVPLSGDVTQHVQRVFDSSPAGSVVIINRHHEVTTQISITKQLHVQGTGGIYCNNFTPAQEGLSLNALVLVAGGKSESPVTYFAPSTVPEGSIVINVLNSEGLFPGDVIEIVSDAIIQNGRDYSFKRQHVQIESTNGNQITLRNTTVYEYASSETVSVYRHDYIDGFTWNGVSVVAQNRSDIALEALSFYFCINSYIEETETKEGNNSSLRFAGSFNCKIDKCTSGLTSEAQSLQYGGLFYNCSYCRATNSYFYSTRTAFDISESDNCYLGFSSLVGSAATHTGTDHLIEGVIATGPAVIRSKNTTISNCDISTPKALYNSESQGAVVADEAARNGGLSIINNRITLSNPNEQGTPVINIYSTPTGQLSKVNKIIGNTLIAISPNAEGIFIRSAGSAGYGAETIVSNNYIESGASSIAFARTEGVTISNNRVLNKGVGSTDLRFAFAFESTGPASKNVVITGNVVEFSRVGGVKSFVDMRGDVSSNMRKVIVTNNVCTGDTSNIFGNIPISEYIYESNLTDS